MEPANRTGASGRSFGKRFKSRLADFVADPVIVCLLLATVTLVLYWPATGFEFVNYDDLDYFTKNTRVQSGLDWDGFCWAFGSGEMSNWHPLTWLSYMLDVTFFGNDSPAGPHFTNIFFHATNSVLLFLLLRRLTGAHWRSALVAGLFAWHPLNVESVAWISERKNQLSTFFGLLTLLAHMRYVEMPGSQPRSDRDPKPRFRIYYGLALAMFACSLMSKPMLVTLPFVLLLLDYWPLGRWQVDSPAAWRGQLPRLAWEKAPYFLVSAATCVVTFMVQQKGQAVHSLADYPIGGRMENVFVSYCRYLVKTFWPEKLTVFYAHPGHWPWATAVPATVFIVIVCLIVVRQGRGFPFLVTGWFWFLGTLVPVIGLIQVGRQAMADRYAYVPLIGIFILVSWGAAEVFTRRKLPATVAAIAAGVALTACILRTKDQIESWQNDGTLFQRAVALTPNYVKGYLTLGYYFEHHGRPDEAMINYRTVIRIDPDHLAAHVNLGAVLESCGRIEEALNEFREAARIAPHSAEVRYNLGCELVRLGRRMEAIEQFTEALRLKPGFVPAERALRELGVSPPDQSVSPLLSSRRRERLVFRRFGVKVCP